MKEIRKGKSPFRKSFVSLVVVVVVVIATLTTLMPNPLIFASSIQPESDSFSDIPKTIGGINCDEVEHLFFHTHTQLIIENQSNTYMIPPNIGIIPNNCLFWLHTHDDSGIIHVESPINSTFVLNDFLQIWNQFDNSPIVKDLVEGNLNAEANVLLENNTKITSSNYKEIELKDNSIIVINIQNQNNQDDS